MLRFVGLMMLLTSACTRQRDVDVGSIAVAAAPGADLIGTWETAGPAGQPQVTLVVDSTSVEHVWARVTRFLAGNVERTEGDFAPVLGTMGPPTELPMRTRDNQPVGVLVLLRVEGHWRVTRFTVGDTDLAIPDGLPLRRVNPG